jgi:hypothetical protein
MEAKGRSQGGFSLYPLAVFPNGTKRATGTPYLVIVTSSPLSTWRRIREKLAFNSLMLSVLRFRDIVDKPNISPKALPQQ